MRIAIIDLLFSWPPHGGADVDVYHVASELVRAGQDVHLIAWNDPDCWERGKISAPESLPFPVEILTQRIPSEPIEALVKKIAQRAAATRPDIVLLGDSFFLKPLLIHALAAFPVICRFYAYEGLCHRSLMRYKDGAPCPQSILTTPQECRKCAVEGLKPHITQGIRLAWIDEYLATRAYSAEYLDALRTAYAKLSGVIVYNDHMAEGFEALGVPVAVLPGGVDCTQFTHTPKTPVGQGQPHIVLMTGRGEDPVKGLDVLMAAGAILHTQRQDFEIWATVAPEQEGPRWFRPLGWCSFNETAELYRRADVCVVPSVWQEPFGMVALEAMATGRPICASAVGGLQHIVADGETGFLFPPGDAPALAAALSRLLDDAPLRQRMGDAARARVASRYTWEQAVTSGYLPFFEQVLTHRSAPCA
ncbi:MAG: glycosyltransferase family 4 protein [Candidatus Hydrogenedentes bacterium]|nr:glycosyltransferase family 4 protein [Candidatus Hydrogenedentota bacterium]